MCLYTGYLTFYYISFARRALLTIHYSFLQTIFPQQKSRGRQVIAVFYLNTYMIHILRDLGCTRRIVLFIIYSNLSIIKNISRHFIEKKLKNIYLLKNNTL